MSANPQIGRSKAWRQDKARRVRTKLGETAKLFANTLLKRKRGEKPSPLAGAKPHAPGKLTMIQRQRLRWQTASELRDEMLGLAA